MKFILIPLFIMVLSQSIKLLGRMIDGEKLSWNTFAWVYHWAGGAPSSHSAMLAASLFMVWKYEGVGPIFGFSVTVSLLFLYNLLEARKRQEIFEGHVRRNRIRSLLAVIRDGKLLDIAGHTYFEVVVGLSFGLVSSWALFSIF